MKLNLRAVQADVQWIPWEFNAEADRLANGRHDSFADAGRVHIDFPGLKWHVLDRAIAWGADFTRQALELRAKRKVLPFRETAGRLRPKETRLRAVDPW